MFFELQAPQNTFPQFLQWCLRLVKVNFSRHLMHTSESAHSGGAELSNMLLATSCRGGKSKRSCCSVL
jgi:hypothetical protein